MTGSEFFLYHRDYVIGRIRGAVFRCQYERAAGEEGGADERCGGEDARQDSFHDGSYLVSFVHIVLGISVKVIIVISFAVVVPIII